MSYSITIPCGCSVYVSCNPATRLAHTRIIEARGSQCPVRRHEVGVRLYLWEILPDRSQPEPAILTEELGSDAHDERPR